MTSEALRDQNSIFKVDLQSLYLQILDKDPSLCDNEEHITNILSMGESLRKGLYAALVTTPSDYPSAFKELEKASGYCDLLVEESESFDIFSSFLYKSWAKVYATYISEKQDLQGNVPEIPGEWLNDEEQEESGIEEVKEEEEEEQEVKIGVLETAISYAIEANEHFKKFTGNCSNKEFIAQPIIDNLTTLAELYTMNGLYQGSLETLKETIEICLSLAIKDNLKLSSLYFMMGSQFLEN